jgi:transketolase
MRRQFGKTIVELAEKDPKLILLYGDVKQNMDEFEKRFPGQIFNCGICEQSTVSMAAGMALEGLHPVVYSLTPFLIERACEQIKMDLQGMQAKVMLVGYDSYPTHGISQTPANARLLMQAFDGIPCWWPTNAELTDAALRSAHKLDGPSFIHLRKDPNPA